MKTVVAIMLVGALSGCAGFEEHELKVRQQNFQDAMTMLEGAGLSKEQAAAVIMSSDGGGGPAAALAGTSAAFLGARRPALSCTATRMGPFGNLNCY